MDGQERKEQKKHQHKHSGPKAQKKKNKKQGGQEREQDARKRNPKAFAVQSAVRMARTFHRLAHSQWLNSDVRSESQNPCLSVKNQSASHAVEL